MPVGQNGWVFSWLWPWVLALTILALHLMLPARRVAGYVLGADGAPLRYRLNGPLVFIATVTAWAWLCRSGWLPWSALFTHRWAMAGGACVMGLIFTLAMVLPVPRVPNWTLLKELFLGRLAQPQFFGNRVDAKMFLYLYGATVLELNLLSFAAAHVERFGSAASLGVWVHVGLFTFFLLEYLVFEEVHLYTYDFVAENVGFKLGWGCLVFYPTFYAVGLWTVAELPAPSLPSAWYMASASVFFAGWMLSRGANLQKYSFKKNPQATRFGPFKQEALEGRVLVSGFWGLSRHINYLGELLMASGLALALGHPEVLGPWLYPLYYVALLVPRQLDDDKRCTAKYGPLWASYVKRVRWRIVPFVY